MQNILDEIVLIENMTGYGFGSLLFLTYGFLLLLGFIRYFFWNQHFPDRRVGIKISIYMSLLFTGFLAGYAVDRMYFMNLKLTASLFLALTVGVIMLMDQFLNKSLNIKNDRIMNEISQPSAAATISKISSKEQLDQRQNQKKIA